MNKMLNLPGKEVHFELKSEPGSQVYVAGTFNHWNPTANQLHDNSGNGHCKATLRLWPGRYEYKFIVNGNWCIDPNCRESVVNNFGCTNSVVHV